MISLRQLSAFQSAWQARQKDRDRRMAIIDLAVAGEFEAYDDDEEEIENRSPNLIQIALEDTAEASSLVPTCRGQALDASDRARKAAHQMERIARHYLQHSNVNKLLVRLAMDHMAYGLHVVTVVPDDTTQMPIIERRDPRTFYPDMSYRPGGNVHRGIFSRAVYFTALPAEYQLIITNSLVEGGYDPKAVCTDDLQVTFIEYFDDTEYLIAATIGGQQLLRGYSAGHTTSDLAVELARTEHGFGVTPIIMDHRVTLDSEFRGQFDQVVSMLWAHIRLMGLVLDYADQAVYSDIWVRDLIGDMPFGGGAFIQLGPQGAIGRVPPAVPGFTVHQDLQMLMDNMHLAARYPKSRPGEVDQSIASAKFVEATVGTMNTVIRQLHLSFQETLERAVRLGFIIDKKTFGGTKKRAVGILNNQEYVEEYDPSDIDLELAQVKVEYGLGLGRDPAQSAVLHIQYGQNEYISKEFVQEHIDGLSDVNREQARIDIEKFQAMVMAKLLEGLQAGMIPERALIDIAKERGDGNTIFDLYEEYVVKPKEEMEAAQVDTGMGMMMPGDPLAAMMGGGGEMGMGGGPIPPPAPAGNELLARINQMGADGTMIGTQNTGGPQ